MSNNSIQKILRAIGYCAWVVGAFLFVSFGIGLLIEYGVSYAVYEWLTTPLGNFVLAATIYGLTTLLVLAPLKVRRHTRGSQFAGKIGLAQPPSLQMLPWSIYTWVVYLITSIMVTLVVASLFPGINLSEEQAIGFQNLTGWFEYLSAFLAEIDRRASKASSAGDVLSDRFVAMVFEASDRRASIGEYAERLGVSVATLYRVVKRSTGKTPLAWIDEAVVSEAKALLNHTDLSVNEIGARVGVLDPSYFSRFFRKQVGVSPVDFREMMKKSHQ